MATVWFCFQSDEKPPPGSQLLVTQQVFHICYVVLFASFKTGAHVVDFSEISYHRASTKEVCVAYESARRNLHHRASGLRMNRVWLVCLWAALLWSRKDFTCHVRRIRKHRHGHMPPHIIFLYQLFANSKVISRRLWSVVASSIPGSFSCRSAHRDSAGTLPPRHEELVYTYLSFTAILTNLIWAALCLKAVLWIICSPLLKGLQVGSIRECTAFGWEKD